MTLRRSLIAAALLAASSAARVKRFGPLVVGALYGGLAGQHLQAATYTWATGASTFDCDTGAGGSPLSPGDIIELAAGNHARKVLRDCDQGTEENPIRVRNPSTGQAIINVGAGPDGHVWQLINFEHLVIEGIDWAGMPPGAWCGKNAAGVGSNEGCGIRVLGSGVSGQGASSMIRGSASAQGERMRSLTVRRIEIDGLMSVGSPATGSCNGAGGDALCIGFTLRGDDGWNASGGGNHIQNITFEQGVIRNVFGEGLYWGNNWQNSPVLRPTRRLRVQDSWFTNINREAIQYKNAWNFGAGYENHIGHNLVTDSGQNRAASNGDKDGISNDGCNTVIDSNYLSNIGGHGIRVVPTNLPITGNSAAAGAPTGTVCPSTIINNLVNGTGTSSSGQARGNGIMISTVTVNGGTWALSPSILNNTVRNAGNTFSAINASGSAGANPNQIRNNVSTGNNPTISVSGYTASNNVTNAAATNFVNAAGGNLQLVEGSSLIDAAHASIYPDEDHIGTERPQGAGADIGAYEFFTVTPPPPPPPPPPPSAAGVTTAKPSPAVIDDEADLYPDHFWPLLASGDDEGDGTPANLTISNAEFVTGLLGPALQFIKANSSYATASLTPATNTTWCVVTRIGSPSGDANDHYVSWGDADAERSIALRASASLGQARVAAYPTSVSLSTSIPIADDANHLLCVRFSASEIAFSKNGSAWETQAASLTLTGLDTFALNRRNDSMVGSYASQRISAVWTFDRALTNDELAQQYNDGNPWPVVGLVRDPDAPQPVPIGRKYLRIRP